MTPELAKGKEIVRRTERATWALIGSSLLLLALLVVAYVNLSIRQKDMQDSIREDALWAVYQTEREARSLLDILKDAPRDGVLDMHERESLLLRYDIVYSRMSVVDTAKYGAYFSDDPEVQKRRARVHADIVGMEPDFDRLKDDGTAGQEAGALEARVADLVADAEELLVRTNSVAAAARADARTEVMHLQDVTAWIVLALGVSVGLLVFSLVSRLRATRAAGDHFRIVADQMSAAFKSAEAGNRAKSEFMATIGHEIRTPLNAILGMTELLSNAALKDEDAECVRIIEASGNGLLEIINEILDFAKIEHGDERSELIPFDPVDVTRQAIGIVAGRARERGNAIDFIPSDLSGRFMGDPTRLRRVLLNLLSNAVKFTENGSIRVGVHDVGAQDAPRLRFEVSDSGIGIPEGSRHLLFQPFSQVDGTIGRRFGGTGLGLAICKRIVEAANGTIGVDSQAGIGSRFWFELPAAAAPADAGTQTQDLTRRDEELPSLRILLVEDNAFNRTVARRFLEKLGQRVALAAEGEAAVRMAEREHFDLILMDMQMPVLDGVEATRRIRNLGSWRAVVPIVALTANASDADRQRCLAGGMDDFEAKPVSMARLKAVIAKWGANTPRDAATGAPVQHGPAEPLLAADAYEIATDAPDIDERRVADLVEAIGEDGLDELRDAFMQDAGSLLADLHEAMTSNDRDRTDRTLHTIKGAASNVGYRAMANLAETMRNGRSNDAAYEKMSAQLRRMNGDRSHIGQVQ